MMLRHFRTHVSHLRRCDMLCFTRQPGSLCAIAIGVRIAFSNTSRLVREFPTLHTNWPAWSVSQHA